ncbi:DUF726 domain-containing protein [Noviherbaspirillum sp. CPCC 100848]|uniref:DUF726 domain-containing protein n=1 Tax=Noviherbaspirillum album TaxID=3080276 RepID=A0ABU6JJG2_9BURK|nr:DUF726 domain-containing protein [Noviherbaspirillum sp. CPCC 100848]MEC4723312.1 DUF726 domain-containing protein [Noviherbaspirillum sp. CPCC 100848]
MTRAGTHWDDNLCAEHDGTIASFRNLELQLDDIEDFETIFERDSTDMLRVGKIGVGVVAGAAILGPVGMMAAPGVATALGGLGVLGAAGTGTTISTLSGAALTSASLAAVGGGSMAAGSAVLAAVGGALGGYKSGVISNGYFGKVEHFDIRKVKKGSRNAVIFVNGLLSEGQDDVEEWTDHLQEHFPRHTWYQLDWEACNLRRLNNWIDGKVRTRTAFTAFKMATSAARVVKGAAGPVAAVTNLPDLVGNPWHTAMVKAQMTGVMLADAIARTKGSRFTLVGHSLGVRVIHYALLLLATKNVRRVDNAYLLGGAVGGGKKDATDWANAERAVKGRIFNCYSEKDDVLRYLYRVANAGLSSPVGYEGIHYKSEQIFDFDCTALVGGHTEWKAQFGEIITQIDDWPMAA